MPIAWKAYGNTVELTDRVKLVSDVDNRGGMYTFESVISQKQAEITIEFTIQNELDTARGFMTVLTQEEISEEAHLSSSLGYSTSVEGITVYVFRHPYSDGKWHVMTLQNMGGRSNLRMKE